jgi:hypothetical protein
MYAIYGNIHHLYTPNVSIYTIHGSYGLAEWSNESSDTRCGSWLMSFCQGKSQGNCLRGSRWYGSPKSKAWLVIDIESYPPSHQDIYLILKARHLWRLINLADISWFVDPYVNLLPEILLFPNTWLAMGWVIWFLYVFNILPASSFVVKNLQHPEASLH